MSLTLMPVGNDLLHGYGGDDTYWLGYGTDHDTIIEHLFNSGDTNDVIKLKGGIRDGRYSIGVISAIAM